MIGSVSQSEGKVASVLAAYDSRASADREQHGPDGLSHSSNCEKAAHLEILSDFTDETLEGELPDKELGGLLVPPNLTKSDGSGAESMGLLDTTSGGLYGE